VREGTHLASLDELSGAAVEQVAQFRQLERELVVGELLGQELELLEDVVGGRCCAHRERVSWAL